MRSQIIHSHPIRILVENKRQIILRNEYFIYLSWSRLTISSSNEGRRKLFQAVLKLLNAAKKIEIS